MLFNSFDFILFLSAFLIGYLFCLNNRMRQIWLLIASLFFYGFWSWKYLLLLITSTSIVFLGAVFISKFNSVKIRKIIFIVCLISDLGILFYFKYLDFFGSSLAQLTGNDWTMRNLILPIGISFYTFQSISYIIDVYKMRIQAEKNYLLYLSFIMFFPQLVAGPIERAQDLLSQIKNLKSITLTNIANALPWILWGYFLKVVVADNLAFHVNKAYETALNGPSTLIATYCFSFQIYCDFAGYSAIAYGISKIIGINLLINFKQPYLSLSFREFWHRWHISLSTWLRDYLYISLGGNKHGKFRAGLNALITMLLGGLWHGANWTFIIWGAVHGLLIFCEDVIGNARLTSKQSRLSNIFKIIITFNIINLVWILFRSENLLKVKQIFFSLFVNWSYENIVETVKSPAFVQLSLYGGIVFIFDYFSNISQDSHPFSFAPIFFRQILYTIIFIFILIFGVSYAEQFIYFQF